MNHDSDMRLNWCPAGIGIKDAEGSISFSRHDEQTDDIFPDFSELPDIPGTLYVPLEHLLVRTFSLPLKQPRLLDASILAQELADTAGIEPDEWWLSWAAGKTETGISGITLALPAETKQTIESHPVLQHTPVVIADGWARLNSWLDEQENPDESGIAVIDTDAEGAFFGVYNQGIWQGIRRLNGDMHDSETRTTIIQQLGWSLQAMGFDSESMPAIGRLTPEMAELFQYGAEESTRKIEGNLPQRHLLNLMLPSRSPQGLNFRHGKWAARKKSAIASNWYRPMILAASLCFLWLAGTATNNYRLESQIAEKQDEIIAAFHRGLPEQPVIIDALAQLQQAARQGGGSSASASVSRQLGVISGAYKKKPWQMKEIKIDNKGMMVAGKAETMESLNQVRENIAAESATDVTIADTDLSDNQVTFKVTWQ